MVGSLVARGVTFLDVPLVTCETVKGVQVRQRAKPGCSAKQLHRPRAVMAAPSFRRGRVGLAHDTISRNPLHVVLVYYQGVAGSLILGNASLCGGSGTRRAQNEVFTNLRTTSAKNSLMAISVTFNATSHGLAWVKVTGITDL